MPISESENHLRTVRMTNPAWMPYSIGLCTSTWECLGEELEKVVLRHPRSWPNYVKGAMDFQHLEYGSSENPDAGDIIDSWGCTWRTGAKGVIGCVIAHPLEELSRLASYVPPDPMHCTHMGPFDWEAHKQFMDREVAAGRFSGGSLDHGFHLLRLEYLLGYENMMCHLAEDTPEFHQVVDMVHHFNMTFLTHMLELGAQTIGLPEDLGTQKGSMIGPRFFRKWVLPYHKELHDLAHRYGAITGFHCDGNIMDVADQILEIGPDIF
ncbi:MAG TPA: uroporphyrinogen decarboxylase family protein, partial [Armatimonadota bacterium]